jgi:hypothetical protein
MRWFLGLRIPVMRFVTMWCWWSLWSSQMAPGGCRIWFGLGSSLQGRASALAQMQRTKNSYSGKGLGA